MQAFLLLRRADCPPRSAGLAVALAGVAVATGVVYPLERVAPLASASVVYIPVVVVAAAYWGIGFGLATAVLSAAAFDFVYIPPVGSFTVADSRNWVALAAFVVIAAAIGLVADLARSRAVEANERRREADFAAEMAQQLLGSARLEAALAVTAHRLAAALKVPSARIELTAVSGDERRLAFPLRDGDGRCIGTLLLPATLAPETRERVATRVVPAMQSILASALHRAELEAEVVETAALRRSDVMKTAILRSVSHDLRTPVTAILTAAEALDPTGQESAAEARDVVIVAATRLWRLVDKLLDLSLLEAGAAEPRREWFAIDEVLADAIDQAGGDPGAFKVSTDAALPLLEGDPGQLERAFANLFENAARYRAAKPVSVNVRAVERRLRVRIVDQGPGIPISEQERIFTPFYRSLHTNGHQGSGLGLAIAKGFIEAGGGRISIVSLPGQGTSVVVDLPLNGEESATPARAGPAIPAAAAAGER